MENKNMRLYIQHFPADLHHELKLLAVQKRIPLYQMIIDVLLRGLAALRKDEGKIK